MRTSAARRVQHIPTLVLAHNPDAVTALADDFRVDLMIAGNTHRGQIVIPGYGAPVTMSRVCGPRSASGWIQVARTPLYVTRGLRLQLPIPIRINCPPETLVLPAPVLTAQHPPYALTHR